MGSSQLEILTIAVLTAASCSLIGSFLILRKMAMMSDAISHTILLGIVLGFFITHDLSSPILIVGATLTGLLTVFLVEILQKTKLVSEDASIGTIFPFLFSIGIILISLYAGNIHLDTDSVLLGELAFAPFDRLIINGLDIGAKSIYVMSTIFLLNLIYIVLFYKELKLVTFDSLLAAAMGISPIIIHYSLMTLVSVTTVGAFNAVGAILVISLMVVPPSTAYFLTESLKKMIIWSVIFGILGALLGFIVAFQLDISIAGSMSVMAGIIFLIVFIISPKKGLITILKRKKKQKYEFAELSLLMHIFNHQKVEYEEIELRHSTIVDHFKWDEKFLDEILGRLIKCKYIEIESDIIKINDDGIAHISNNPFMNKTNIMKLEE